MTPLLDPQERALVSALVKRIEAGQARHQDCESAAYYLPLVLGELEATESKSQPTHTEAPK